jgi:hypothetical protein
VTGSFSSESILKPALRQHFIELLKHIKWSTAQAGKNPASQAIAVYIKQLETAGTENMAL